MATKKFSNFEYASLTDAGDAKTPGLYRFDAFETPHGHAFVVVSGDQDDEKQADLCEIAIERIQYYLENEPDDDKHVVSRNALIYSSGYLYQMGRKDSLDRAGKISCLCVLFSEEKIYFSWVGHVELFLFTGKRMYLLSWKDSEADSASMRIDEETGLTGKECFLGSQAIIAPYSIDCCVEPVSNDILIMASGSVCRRLHTKDIKKVLQDSMPLQTKAARIMRHSSSESGQCPASIMLLRFHDLGNAERSFGAGRVAAKHDPSMQKTEQAMAKKKQTGSGQGKTFKLLMTIFSVIGLIIVAYLIYDLFISDPRPPVSLPPIAEEVVADTSEHVMVTEPNEEQLAAETAVLPDDVIYVVRGGDTWGRIYVQYGVCSWFIINHTPNTGRFGRESSLIAGERLRIPVKYSGKAEYNPHYYREFTTEKVGSRCENAGPELLQAFEEKIAR